MATVLLVDDDRAVLFTLEEILAAEGHTTVTASSGADALAALDSADAVVTDLSMPGMDGLALLRAVQQRDPSLPVVLLTAHGSERIAVGAMKAGAFDYLPKPFDAEELVLVVSRALELRRLRTESRRLQAEQLMGRRVVGSSPAFRALLDTVARVATRDVTVLVRGETGTGKELVASLLHAQSGRAGQPFVRFNCAAIPGELAEVELFGHARGAFTGAGAARRGFFAEAHGGTLVLDEVGELPLAAQATLLRALQDGEIQPVGSGRVERVDVRLVACTNRDLARDAQSKRFRDDLYYRLAVVELVVPPLRERRDDIPALAIELARRYGEKFGLEDVSLSDALIDWLAREEWPGNVRQLENTIARLCALSNGGVLDVDGLPGEPAATPEAAAETAADGAPSLREQVEAFERNLVKRALAATGGNQSEAARRVGVSRATLIDRMKKYRLA